jgi:hypothetical protein
MRRVIPPSDCRDRGQYQGEKLARASRIMVALFVLLMPAMPLRAQSELKSFPGLHEFSSTPDSIYSYDPGALDLGFNPDSGPILAAGNGVSLMGNASTEPGPLHSSINFEKVCAEPANCRAWYSSEQPISTPEVQQSAQGSKADAPDADSKADSDLITQHRKRPDRNLDIYYRNRREFSLDVGWHPVNIPFIYDFAVGGGYNETPLKYTLVPIVASLRWHVTNVGWRGFFRGNMDFTFSGSLTVIPRGPETHYYSFDFGIRRNFVYRNWKVVPFFEQRGGAGIINAQEPLGIEFAQGQNLTFTYNLGVGARYNIDSKYSFSAGMNYMHISNAYLSQPQFYNYGINVYGPMFGLDVRLGKPHHSTSQ